MSALTESIVGAASNMTKASNNCGLADSVSATHDYTGTTTAGANIFVSGGEIVCGANDGTNVVSWGNLIPGAVGVMCPWLDKSKSPWDLLNGDIELNKGDGYLWTFNPPIDCLEHFDVESVLTHEFGHVWGLDDLDPEAHPGLTMSDEVFRCSTSLRTLGLGDIRGLEALY